MQHFGLGPFFRLVWESGFRHADNVAFPLTMVEHDHSYVAEDVSLGEDTNIGLLKMPVGLE